MWANSSVNQNLHRIRRDFPPAYYRAESNLSIKKTITIVMPEGS